MIIATFVAAAEAGLSVVRRALDAVSFKSADCNTAHYDNARGL